MHRGECFAMSCFFGVFLDNAFSCTGPCFSPLLGAYVSSNRGLFFFRIHSGHLGDPKGPRGGPRRQFDGPLGSPRGPFGGPRGADLCSHAGETLVFVKSERFACTRHQLARLGATEAPLGRPSGSLGRPWGVPRGALGPSLWTFLHQGLSTTLLLTNSNAELLRI